MAEPPRCKNKDCPRSDTFLLAETDTNWTFGCWTCRGLHVYTKPMGWRAGQQEHRFKTDGRPEWARKRAFFGMGRNRMRL